MLHLNDPIIYGERKNDVFWGKKMILCRLNDCITTIEMFFIKVIFEVMN
jgi:hypothetical protein